MSTYMMLFFLDYSPKDSQLLAIEVLLSTHHPLVLNTNYGLWLKVVKHLKLQPKQLIGLYGQTIKNSYIAEFRCTGVS